MDDASDRETVVAVAVDDAVVETVDAVAAVGVDANASKVCRNPRPQN